ncbi:hypothetical protein K8S17_01295 [bacterium]|nr:hypothetical protein [bacterium]
MLLRAIAIWFLLMVLAICNGVLRNSVITPRVGEHAGHVTSTIVLCFIILLVTFYAIRWIGPATDRDALLVGVFWVVLTVGFEFLAGHYAFGHSWTALLVDYDVSRGRVWLLVPVTTLLAPRVAVALRYSWAAYCCLLRGNG